ncbi:MAG: hypothetical protein ABGZ17_25720, partial [Planctomycetaceae bacterium]
MRPTETTGGLRLKSLKSPTKSRERTIQPSSEIEFINLSSPHHNEDRSGFLVEMIAAPDFKRLTIAAGYINELAIAGPR